MTTTIWRSFATGVFAATFMVPVALHGQQMSLEAAPMSGDTAPGEMQSGRAADRLIQGRRPVRAIGMKPGSPNLPIVDPGLVNPFIAGTVIGIEQVNRFDTGYDESNNPLPIPSIDPAGVVYHSGLGGLVIADSEITEIPEVFNLIGATHFLTPTSGGVTWLQWDLAAITGIEPDPNLESTGIAHCENDGHVYITNDDTDLIYRYQFDGTSFSVVDFVSTRPITFDPEGITCDPATGRLYVVGGINENILVYTYEGGFVFHEELELDDTAGNPNGELEDVEGIAFDPATNHLFVVSDPAARIVEYDLQGRYIKHFELDALSPEPIAPQGLSIGPSSTHPGKSAFYLTDGGIDNDQDPTERDGAIYELLIKRIEGR